MSKINISALLLSLVLPATANAASLKVLEIKEGKNTTLFDTDTVRENALSGDPMAPGYSFKVDKWSCQARYFTPVNQAILECGNQAGLVVSSSGDNNTYLTIDDGRNLEGPTKHYEIRLTQKRSIYH